MASSDFILSSRKQAEQIRDSLMEDENLLVNWRDIKDSFLSASEDRYKIEMMIKDREPIRCVILDTLELWMSRCGNNATFWACIDILKKGEWNYASDLLQKKREILISIQTEKTSSEAQMSLGIWFDVREPVGTFTGREKELTELFEMCRRNQDSRGITIISQLTSVSGLGGIGKSDMARKFAKTYCSFFDNNVIWINAEKYDTSKASFMALARRLKIPIEEMSGGVQIQRDFTVILNDIFTHFHHKKCLFIFDNVEVYRNGSEGVYHFLPTTLPPHAIRPYVLITSRNSQLIDGVETLSLGVLTFSETRDFIRKPEALGPQETDTDIKRLAALLQSLPLALQQAVAYIRKFRNRRILFRKDTYSIEDYCNEFENKTKELLNYEYFKVTGDIYEQTVLLTWVVTLMKINEEKYGSNAIQIIRMISYFNPDSIPVDLFKNYLPNDELEEAVMLLIQFSMVDGTDDATISIHRLVQQVVRIQIQDDFLIENIWTSAVILFDDYDKEDTMWKRWVPHAESLWNFAYLSENLVERFTEFPIKICRRMKGKDALAFQQRIIDKFERFRGKHNKHVLNLKCTTVHCLMLNKEWKLAEEQAREIYPQAKKHLGEGNEITLTCLCTISECLEEQGRLETAIEIGIELHSIQTRLFGAQNHKSLDTLLTVSMRRMKTRMKLHLEKAYADLKFIFESYKVKMGETYSETLRVQSMISDCLKLMGNMEESNRIRNQVDTISSELHGTLYEDGIIVIL